MPLVLAWYTGLKLDYALIIALRVIVYWTIGIIAFGSTFILSL